MHEEHRQGMRKIVLGHCGETDTLAAIPALAKRYDASVVTLTVNIGQDGTSAGWRQHALDAGAIRAHVLDARDEFARDYILRALQAAALGNDVTAQGSALYRALLADKLVGVASMEGASIVGHGLDPQSDEALDLEHLILDRHPDLIVISARSLAPEDCQATAGHPHGTPQDPALLRVESTLWWRRAVLDVSDASPVPKRIPGVRQGLFTVPPVERCPPGAALIEVAFEQGVPVSINGIEMPLVELIEAVDTIAGDHGVGRSVAEVATSGTRRVTVLEAPAARVLTSAHAALARAVESPSLWRLHRQLGRRYAMLLDSGCWYSDARRAIDAFAGETRTRLSGAVRLELRGGRCKVVTKSIRAERTETPAVASTQPVPAAPARVAAPHHHRQIQR
jgi:argininosuccinate synthase